MAKKVINYECYYYISSYLFTNFKTYRDRSDFSNLPNYIFVYMDCKNCKINLHKMMCSLKKTWYLVILII